MVAKAVPDQPDAVNQLATYLQSIYLLAAEQEEASPASSSVPSVLLLYGPSSTGKTGGADLTTLVILRRTYDMPAEVLRDPEEALKRWCLTDQSATLACLTINMSDYGNKPAQVMELIEQRFRDLQERIDEHDDDDADPDAVRPLQDIVLTFDEIHLANVAVLQVLAQLTLSGEVTARKSKKKIGGKGTTAGSVASVRCPCRLTIILLANSPEQSVMVRVPVPTQAQVMRELRHGLFKGIDRLHSRFLHWVVPFYPYTKAQWASILHTCLGRLRQDMCDRTGLSRLYLHMSCTAFAQRCFKIHEWHVRSAMKQLRVSFDAAIMPEQRTKAAWKAVLLRVVDGRSIVAEQVNEDVGVRPDVLKLVGQPKPDMPQDDVAMIAEEEKEAFVVPAALIALPSTEQAELHHEGAVPSVAQQHLQQVEQVWRAVDTFLNSNSRCTFVADPSVISLCHRAIRAVHPFAPAAAVGAELPATHLETLRTICTMWLGSCQQWCIAHANGQERALRILVQRPSAAMLRFSVRAVDDWDMCGMDLCTAQHPYPRDALWKVQFEASHLASLAEANAIQWVKRVYSLPLFSGSQWLDALMSCLSVSEGDAPVEELHQRLCEQHFPWCHDGPGSYADAKQFFVQLDGLVEHDAIETFAELAPCAPIDVPTVLMRASPTQALVPYVPLSTGVLQALFGWSSERTKLLYERVRGAFRVDHHGRLAHLYITANPEERAQRTARIAYQQRLCMQLPGKVGFVPLLALQQVGRSLCEGEGNHR